MKIQVVVLCLLGVHFSVTSGVPLFSNGFLDVIRGLVQNVRRNRTPTGLSNYSPINRQLGWTDRSRQKKDSNLMGSLYGNSPRVSYSRIESRRPYFNQASDVLSSLVNPKLEPKQYIYRRRRPVVHLNTVSNARSNNWRFRNFNDDNEGENNWRVKFSRSSRTYPRRPTYLRILSGGFDTLWRRAALAWLRLCKKKQRSKPTATTTEMPVTTPGTVITSQSTTIGVDNVQFSTSPTETASTTITGSTTMAPTVSTSSSNGNDVTGSQSLSTTQSTDDDDDKEGTGSTQSTTDKTTSSVDDASTSTPGQTESTTETAASPSPVVETTSQITEITTSLPAVSTPVSSSAITTTVPDVGTITTQATSTAIPSNGGTNPSTQTGTTPSVTDSATSFPGQTTTASSSVTGTSSSVQSSTSGNIVTST